MAHRAMWTLLCLSCVAAFVTAQSPAATDAWVSAAPEFLQLQWSDVSLLHLSLSEPLLVDGIKTFYETTAVKAVDVRNSTDVDAATGNAVFEMLFLIGDAELVASSEPPTLDTTDLVAALVDHLATATATLVLEAAQSFQDGVVLCEALSSADVHTRYGSTLFPVIATIPTPNAAFLLLSVFFNGMEGPEDLAQSVVYQVQRGVSQFLGGDFRMDSVVSTGPAESVTNSTLVSQSYFLLVPGILHSTMAARQAFASLLINGDPSLPIAGDNASNTHPATFVDFIFSNEEVKAASDQDLPPVLAATLVPVVFDSINVDPYPVGNPALPTPSDIEMLSAITESQQNARRIKTQQFANDPNRYTAALPHDVEYPSEETMADSNISGNFSTVVYWSNKLTQDFWLESAESADPIDWNLFPSNTFFTVDATPPATLPAAPLVLKGNTSTPLWILQGVTPEHVDMTLNLRGVTDATVTVKVAVKVTLHDTGEAESTVTSVARSASTSTATTPATPSDIVVRHQSRLQRNGVVGQPSRLLLLLELGTAKVTEKSADRCAHCQELSDWCSNEAECAALQTCVWSAIKSSISTLITSVSTLYQTEDLYPYFQRCVTAPPGTAASPISVSDLMLFTSVLRCQSRRQCPFPLPDDIANVPAGLEILWNTSQGQHHIQPLAGATHFPLPDKAPVNVSLSIADEVVCYLPMWNNVTNESLETLISQCGYSKYLGRVKVITHTDSIGVTSVDITYSGIIGPMPILMPVATATATDPVGAVISTVAEPSLYLQVDSDSIPVSYDDTVDPTQLVTCNECKRLAVEVCLGDAKCAAMADCILQYGSDRYASTQTLASRALRLIQMDEANMTLSFEEGVTSCIPSVLSNGVPSVDVNDESWRKLVEASACYSRSGCPVVLAPALSTSSSSVVVDFKTVGVWTITPARKLQRLIYTGNASRLEDIEIPLAVHRDGGDQTLNSSGVPVALQGALRTLVGYDDITVSRLVVPDSSSTSAAEMFAWTIGYGHWIGPLPVFISASSDDWTLASYPTITAETSATGTILSPRVQPNKAILTMVPRRSNETASSWSGSDGDGSAGIPSDGDGSAGIPGSSSGSGADGSAGIPSSWSGSDGDGSAGIPSGADGSAGIPSSSSGSDGDGSAGIPGSSSGSGADGSAGIPGSSHP